MVTVLDPSRPTISTRRPAKLFTEAPLSRKFVVPLVPVDRVAVEEGLVAGGTGDAPLVAVSEVPVPAVEPGDTVPVVPGEVVVPAVVPDVPVVPAAPAPVVPVAPLVPPEAVGPGVVVAPLAIGVPPGVVPPGVVVAGGFMTVGLVIVNGSRAVLPGVMHPVIVIRSVAAVEVCDCDARLWLDGEL